MRHLPGLPTVERVEVEGSPVAVGDRTVIPVARARRVAWGAGPVAFARGRASPSHVEVLEADGRRYELPVRDVERALRRALTLVAGLALLSGQRRAERGRTP